MTSRLRSPNPDPPRRRTSQCSGHHMASPAAYRWISTWERPASRNRCATQSAVAAAAGNPETRPHINAPFARLCAENPTMSWSHRWIRTPANSASPSSPGGTGAAGAVKSSRSRTENWGGTSSPVGCGTPNHASVPAADWAEVGPGPERLSPAAMSRPKVKRKSIGAGRVNMVEPPVEIAADLSSPT